GGWCRYLRRCLVNGVQILSSPNLSHGSRYQRSRPRGELTVTKSYSGNREYEKFRDEAKKLKQSDALLEVRRKHKSMESDTVRPSEAIKKLGELTGTVKESLDEVSKSDLGQKIKEEVEEGEKKLGKMTAFKAVSQGVEETDGSGLGQMGPYRRPERLWKRTEFAGAKFKESKANEEVLGVVLLKDSKWYQQWKEFQDNNVVCNRVFEMKM
ncbi:LOW QUALITY PROTEIN: hypothetical protein U0070_022750, partial [Myodes glareolus]